MRAVITDGEVTPEQRQDSSLLSVLASANALMVRPPHDPAQSAGTLVDIIDI
jgi:molybdopterin molybdotransferase